MRRCGRSLLDHLADGARVVNLASAKYEMTRLDLPDLELERDYSAVRAYARSKLAIVMYTRWLAGRLAERNVTAVSLRSIERGATTSATS